MLLSLVWMFVLLSAVYEWDDPTPFVPIHPLYRDTMPRYFLKSKLGGGDSTTSHYPQCCSRDQVGIYANTCSPPPFQKSLEWVWAMMGP